MEDSSSTGMKTTRGEQECISAQDAAILIPSLRVAGVGGSSQAATAAANRLGSATNAIPFNAVRESSSTGLESTGGQRYTSAQDIPMPDPPLHVSGAEVLSGSSKAAAEPAAAAIRLDSATNAMPVNAVKKSSSTGLESTGGQKCMTAKDIPMPNPLIHVAGAEDSFGSTKAAVELPAAATATRLDNAIAAIPVNVVVANSDTAAEVKMKPRLQPDPPALVVVKPIVAGRASLSLQGSTDRQLTGMKPIVPLRKRGQSFRETKNMITTVDADGRRRLNQ